MKDLYETLGDREITIVREITKIHEEVIKTNLAFASEKYSDNSLRGEIVLIIEGKKDDEESEITLEDALVLAHKYMEDGMGASMAAKQAAKETGIKKGDIYKALQ